MPPGDVPGYVAPAICSRIRTSRRCRSARCRRRRSCQNRSPSSIVDVKLEEPDGLPISPEGFLGCGMGVGADPNVVDVSDHVAVMAPASADELLVDRCADHLSDISGGVGSDGDLTVWPSCPARTIRSRRFA